jgi:uncharacterized protein DUF1937
MIRGRSSYFVAHHRFASAPTVRTTLAWPFARPTGGAHEPRRARILGEPKYPHGIEAAFRDVCKLAASLLLAGIKCYSPIAHTHPIAKYGNLNPRDHSIWLPFDGAMMRVADVLLVAHMDGWGESVGIAHEIKFFTDAKKPIYDLDPESHTMIRRGESAYV